MRRPLLPILALVLGGFLGGRPAPPAAAEDEGGTDCGLYAVLRGNDKGELTMYDGVRKGLEFARLPRVCLEVIEPWPQGLRPFLDRLARAGGPGSRSGPLFGIGDDACEALAAAPTTIPRVFVVQRYTVERQPLRPLPVARGAVVVYADLGAQRLGQVLRGLFGPGDVRAEFPWGVVDAPSREADLTRLRRAAGITEPDPIERRPARVLLHLRLGIGYPLLPFEQALDRAKRAGIPLISDDRARFGQGAAVTLVARHDLVGRAAAEVGRRLQAEPDLVGPPRAITGVEVWVDLQSADAQGIDVPLPFLATADRLKRGQGPR